MLKISNSPETVWVDIAPGARIRLQAWTTQTKAAGQTASRAAIEAGHPTDVAGVAFTIGAVKWAALAWEGVGDDDGEPLALTPANLELLLTQHPGAYARVDAAYVLPGLNQEAEKNVSAPSRDGTSQA